jgi:hypothetical protein
MTRRGSLVYYMSAVAFGSMFVSATFWLYHDISPGANPEPSASFFLRSYFNSAVLSFVPLLLDAFVLRRLAVYCHWKQLWVWVFAGGPIFVCVEWVLAATRMLAPGTLIPGWEGLLFTLIGDGPNQLLEKPYWLWPIPGLGTAYVLFLVYRAFELQPSVTASVELRS